MKNKYIIVEFPETQKFEEHERFQECLYLRDNCQLAVPEDLYNNVMDKNNNPERILCAAVKRKSSRDCKPYDNPNDICNVELGYRHHDIWMRFPNELSFESNDQGFFTSTGRFVNRHEAFRIAQEANQISRKDGPDVLISEDLY